MTPVHAAMAIFALAGLLCPPATASRVRGPVDFVEAVGASRPAGPVRDVWHVTEDTPTPLAWMTATDPLAPPPDLPAFGIANSFQQLLDRMADTADRSQPVVDPWTGMNRDPGRWRYKLERSESLYKRTTKLELPDPAEVRTVPYGGRDWKAQEKVQIPVPIPVMVAEQLFVYGQFDGSGDALNSQQTSLSGKTGVGMKWSLLAGSELQLRYATLFSYADAGSSRYQERAQPAVELVARMPLVGPLELEYTGSAIPAVTRSDSDQFKQELRLALPLKGDNELEFGARYRWDTSPTPWLDRAQLFLGVKLRH
ncbi:MAG TPA: DUF481 domain-containing protein [Gemmataceae bacterium]|nr:DUF481 domain-containing protein [Gemmataceae bacterium]